MTQKSPPKSDQRESGIVQRMRKSVRQLPVVSPHVLLACSGGKDSVALAWILAELRRLELLTFSIAHIHHGQHDRADEAADAIREIGRSLNASVTVHRLQQQDIDTHVGVGPEEAMRRERYLALTNIAVASQANCIALAHHQTDQAETILLHLMRGSGIDGLVGMGEIEERTVPWWESSMDASQVLLWRPLITEPAEDVAANAESSGLPVVEDPTNIDTKYRRNAIRHQLLPVLEEISAGSTAAIARSADVIAADAYLLEVVTSKAFSEIKSGDSLSRAKLTAQPLALQKRVVRAWLVSRLPMVEISAERIAAVVELVARNRGRSQVDVGSGHRVRLQDGLLSVD